jgi:protein TonB
MEYGQLSHPGRNATGIVAVVVFHALLVYALVNGLAQKVVEVVKGPLETKIIEEIKPPPPAPDVAPPPKFVPPPPSFVPPPEVNIAEAPAENTISAVTSQKPVEAAPPIAAAPAAVHKAPVVRSKSCREPEYPSASERVGEAGKVVLALLIGVDGRVVDSKVETSSGFPRLDQAAKDALSLCKFEPGTVDGKPEQAWGKLAYVFKNPDQ